MSSRLRVTPSVSAVLADGEERCTRFVDGAGKIPTIVVSRLGGNKVSRDGVGFDKRSLCFGEAREIGEPATAQNEGLHQSDGVGSFAAELPLELDRFIQPMHGVDLAIHLTERAAALEEDAGKLRPHILTVCVEPAERRDAGVKDRNGFLGPSGR